MIQDDILRIYPFIIDGIEDARDSHFSIYKKITASGMAFSELGKTGYKLELNSHTIESELEENKDLLPTINYWLDKVFPNRKDENGNIIEWLTPWCYEIRMDWSHYTAAERDSTKIYEDDYVSSWAVKEQDGMAAALVPAEKTIGLEKCRYIDCANSNKYNITQTLAETFGVFCVYEYKCNEHGNFISQYTDPITKKVWQGRKVIFYNRAIKTDKPLYVDYQKNLSTIQRTADSAELYTKLFVKPIDSSIASSGLISIADTPVNPLLDEFILNFDYLYSKGSITEYQWNYINTYKANLRKINLTLQELSPTIEELTANINDLETKISILQKEIESAQKTLTEYETLKNNEGTNGSVTKDKTNTYSVIFIKEDNCYSASIRLQGIDVHSISGYEDYKYEKKAFSITDGSLIISSKKPSSITDNTNFYVLLDEYGYPNEIYASLQNSKIYKGDDKNPHTSFYLELTYTPANAYASICSTLQNTIATKAKRKEALESDLKEDQANLETNKEDYASSSKDKEELNRKFELMMGPALREGYWTPEAYDDPGEGIEADKKGFVLGKQDDSAYLVYDDTPFDEEELGYYYDSPLSMENNDRKYYAYIPYSSIGLDKIANPELLELYIYDAYTKTASQNIAPKWYFVLINGTKYFIDLTKKATIPQGSKLTITYTTSDLNNIALYCDDTYVTDFSTETSVVNPPQLDDCSCKILRKRTLYNKAGYAYHFIRPKLGEQIIPVLLLNDNTVAYNGYDDEGDKNNYTVRLAYNFTGSEVTNKLLSNQIIVYPKAGGEATNYKIHYPRIILNSQNVNYESDLLSISTYSDEIYDEAKAKRLEKFIDYAILLRGGKPYITLKITSDHTINDILSSSYHIYYQISRANEMLYLDAKEVAFENSRPRYSYSLSVANIPDENQVVELGQLAYINDYSLGVHAATGYISGITFDLAKPQEDSLTIQNYKTKFEDLFSTITASSEAMKNNQASYNIAAAAFTGNGQIAGSVLQQSINSNNLSFNYSGTNVEISPIDGIILTNTTAYYNGVYGQVALRGGGIFLSDAIDGSGARIWNTAITPNGINASLITAGQLDTEAIRIFAGDNLAFQWNSEGIFAYVRDESTGQPDLTSYVRYSEKGLQYINGDHTVVDLGWNGLLIDTADGGIRLTGQKGLEIFHGDNTYASLGRIEENKYGLQLYDEDGTISLAAVNGGDLWLRKTIIVGEDRENIDGNAREYIAGISGEVLNEDYANKAVRFWAGSLNRDTAPFRVLQDGSLFASLAEIEGTITASKGFIGGWEINETSISSTGITLGAGTNGEKAFVKVGVEGSNQYASLNGDGTFSAAGVNISGTINASGGSIGGLQIADVSALGGDTSIISLRLTTTDGLAYKTGTTASITFKSEGLRGNIPFTLEEYNSGIKDDKGELINRGYSIFWYKSLDGNSWELIRAVNLQEGLTLETLDPSQVFYHPMQTLDDLYQTFELQVNEPIQINCKLIPLGETGGEPS